METRIVGATAPRKNWTWGEILPTGLSVLLCFAFPITYGPALRKMFEDFHTSLTPAAELALSWWLPLLLGVAQLLVLRVLVRLPFESTGRAITGLLAFLFALGTPTAIVVGAYTPLTSVMGDVGLDLPPRRGANGQYQGVGGLPR